MDSNIKLKLNDIYSKYHNKRFLKNDPLVWVHGFKNDKNIEIAGLIGSSIAYGRVEKIIESLYSVKKITGEDIFSFVMDTSYSKKNSLLNKFIYRFNNGTDFALLFECVKHSINKFGSIGNHFHDEFVKSGENMKKTLCGFSESFKKPYLKIFKKKKKSFEFLLPSPLQGSTCKRLNMYMRWMIRKKDGIDFGAWENIPSSVLFMPVDTHIAKIARSLKFTQRKSADWKTVEEITDYLKKIDSFDPVKYDFSLCQSGMRDFRNKQESKI